MVRVVYRRPPKRVILRQPLNLDDLFPSVVPPVVSVTINGSLDAAFLAFHAANPWVYVALVQLSRDLKQRGRGRQGIKMLFEVLRWHWWRRTIDPASDFKLNNNYHSRYARLIMEQEPDLVGVFELRALVSH